MRIRLLLILIISASLLLPYDRDNHYVSVESYRSYVAFIKGVRFYHEGRFEAALDSFGTSLTYDSKDAVTLYWFGKTLYKSGKEQEALTAWENVERMGLADALLKSKIDRLSSTSPDYHIKEKFKDFIFLKKFSQNSTFEKYIKKPIDVAVDSANRLYVAEYDEGLVKVFSMNGDLLKTFSSAGENKIRRPRDISLDDDENIYISDFGSDAVHKFDSDWEHVWSIGGSGYAEGAFYGPSAADTDESGKVYVVDSGNNRVQIFSKDGIFLSSFGKLGKEPGSFFRPAGIAVTDDAVYVADSGNMRVQRFDRYGNYEFTLNNDSFYHPRYISHSKDGNLFITDEKNIFYYEIKSSSFYNFSRSKYYSLTPMGVSEGEEGSFYVADMLQGDIDVFVQKEMYYANMNINLEQTILSEFPTVVHQVSVRDDKGDPIIGLSADNFYVSEFGEMIKPVRLYEKHKDMGEFRFIYLVDSSEAAGRMKEDMLRELNNFTDRLSGKDEVMLIHFNDEIDIIPGFETRNMRIKLNAEDTDFEGGTSALSEAIYEAVRQAHDTYRQTVVVIFTASDIKEDAFQFRYFDTCANMAKNNFVIVNAFSLLENNYFLEAITEESYGEYVYTGESVDYAGFLDGLKETDTGRYYILYNTDGENPGRDDYRPMTLTVEYRDMIGKEESGYVLPKGFILP